MQPQFPGKRGGYAWNPAVAPARKLEHTSLKTSMGPENTSMEKEKHLQNQQFWGCHFSGLFESWCAIGPCLGAEASASLVIMVLQGLYIWGRRKFGFQFFTTKRRCRLKPSRHCGVLPQESESLTSYVRNFAAIAERLKRWRFRDRFDRFFSFHGRLLRRGHIYSLDGGSR